MQESVAEPVEVEESVAEPVEVEESVAEPVEVEESVAEPVEVQGAEALTDGPTPSGVLGVGVDLVHVPTFVDQLDLPGTHFAGVFTPGERRDAAERAARVDGGGHGGGEGRHLAARWAAKEAFVKAWSASIFGEPPLMGDEVLRLVEVVCDAWGRPRLRLHGEVAAHLPDVEAHVSLSHDGDHAVAYVVLAEAVRR